MTRSMNAGATTAFAVAVLVLSSSCRRVPPIPGDEPGHLPGASQSGAPSRLAPGASAPAPAASAAPKVAVPVAFKADARALGAARSVTACALDQLGPTPATDSMTVTREGDVGFIGWAADPTDGTVPPVVTIELSGPQKYFAAAARLTKRPDVAAALKAPALIDSGYDAVASFAAVEPGVYDVRVTQVTAWAEVLTCETRRKIKVQ